MTNRVNNNPFFGSSGGYPTEVPLTAQQQQAQSAARDAFFKDPTIAQVLGEAKLDPHSSELREHTIFIQPQEDGPILCVFKDDPDASDAPVLPIRKGLPLYEIAYTAMTGHKPDEALPLPPQPAQTPTGTSPLANRVQPPATSQTSGTASTTSGASSSELATLQTLQREIIEFVQNMMKDQRESYAQMQMHQTAAIERLSTRVQVIQAEMNRLIQQLSTQQNQLIRELDARRSQDLEAILHQQQEMFEMFHEFSIDMQQAYAEQLNDLISRALNPNQPQPQRQRQYNPRHYAPNGMPWNLFLQMMMMQGAHLGGGGGRFRAHGAPDDHDDFGIH